MTDEKAVMITGGKLWLNASLLAAVVLTTGLGVYRFTGIEYAIEQAGSSLEAIGKTVDKIEVQLGTNAGAIAAGSAGLAVLRAKVEAQALSIQRLEATILSIESRMREIERK